MSSESSNRLLFDVEDGEHPVRRGLDPRRKRMYIFLVGALVISLVIGIIVLTVANQSSSDDGSNDQRREQTTYDDYQNQFLQAVSGDNIKANMREFSSVSHIAGSPSDFAQANETKRRFEKFGIPSVTLDEIPVFLTYPITRTVEIVGGFKCSLKEEVLADGTSNLPAIDTFHGYSPSGDVTGALVYANYGREEDYALLDQQGISLADRIVIVRYGKIFRGNKVLGAQQRGAKGVLIYTDPQDTGYDMGKPYMEGPWSTNTSVQRGSVWVGYGDPTTPGWGSTKDGYRLNLTQARDPNLTLNLPLPLIPSQPLSWNDAAPLLQTLTSGDLPLPAWQGGLPFKYYVGPSTEQIHMAVTVNETVTNIWNVIGKIPGKYEPDRYVLVGCHRDAWTFGAGDPISAHSTLLEIVRVMGDLYKSGWQPRRTIVFASWDAEEYGLVGSTEFVEGNYQTLIDRSVVYFNIDIAVKGRDYLLSKGSPSITDLLLEATQKVSLASGTVKDKWEGIVQVPGTGSDFVAFIHHAGIAMNHIEFKSVNNSYEAVYHSNYDSFYWFSNFGDPDFSYHAAIGKVLGYCVMRFGNSLVVPMGLGSYADALNSYIAQIREGTNLDFSPMTNATAHLKNAVAALEVQINLAKNYDDSITDEILRSINDRLTFFERSFLTDESRLTGLSPWFKHIVLAPSKYDGYAGVAFGALAGAVQTENWTEAQYLIKRYALIIEGAAQALEDNPL